MSKVFFAVVTIFLSLFICAGNVFADDPLSCTDPDHYIDPGDSCEPDVDCCSGGPKCPESGVCPSFENFADIVKSITRILYPLALLIGFGMIIKSGYALMTSEGNPGKTKEAYADLVAAITGIVFVVLSVVILRIIIGTVTGT